MGGLSETEINPVYFCFQVISSKCVAFFYLMMFNFFRYEEILQFVWTFQKIA